MKKLLLCLVFTALLVPAFSLEVRRGSIRLVVHEDFGSFSVFFTGRDGSEESFFLSQDPRTSSISLLLDNRVYRLGQNTFFRQQVSETPGGASIVWTGGNLRVGLDFLFLSSQEETPADGLQLKLTVENLQGPAQNTSVRFLFDTHLGEGRGAHFFLSDGQEIRRELELLSPFPAFWVSGRGSVPGALQVMMNARGVTTPDRVVFANWKRLNETSWHFDVRTSRSFNYLPYSTNDSAVCHYYDLGSLASGAKREVFLFLGAYNSRGFSAASLPGAEGQYYSLPPEQSGGTGVPGSSAGAGQASAGGIEAQIRRDIDEVNSLLGELEGLLASQEHPDPRRVQTIRDRIRELEDRIAGYRR